MIWTRVNLHVFLPGLQPRIGGVVSTASLPTPTRRHRRVGAAPRGPTSGRVCAEPAKKQQQQLAARQESQLSELDEIVKLVQLLPPSVKDKLESHPQLLQLVEVVMDLGRPPLARFPSGDEKLSSKLVTDEDLEEAVTQVGDFGGDNRAGIDKTLHRISCIRNRAGRIVGLTCRVGRAIPGSAAMVDDLIRRNASILMLGRPGVGKTTAIREISRKLADEYRKRVVIVDTSNEIGGDGDIPHPGIGGARRMQVPDPSQQHRVMIEAVENHTPEVIVIDEIGTEAEALAARTIAQRGVQLVATAHGNELENVMKNPSLNDLVGGISSVTLGDEEAKRRGVQKSILERSAPPTFDVAVEMSSREQWRVHLDVAEAVDKLLTRHEPNIEVRERDADGRVWSWPYDAPTDSDSDEFLPALPASGGASKRQQQRQQQRPGRGAEGAGAGSGSSAGGGSSGGFPQEALKAARQGLDPGMGTYAAAWRAGRSRDGPTLLVGADGELVADNMRGSVEPAGSREAVLGGSSSSSSSQQPVQQAGRLPSAAAASPAASKSSSSSGSGAGALRLFVYGVDGGSIWSVGNALRLEGKLELCDRLEEADAVLALRSKLKSSAWVKEAARLAGMPVFAIKSGGVGDVTRALRTLLGIDPSPGGLFAGEAGPVAADPKVSNSRNSRAEASIALVAAAGRPGGGRQRGGSAAAAAAAATALEAQQAQADAAALDGMEEARLAVEQIVIPRGQPIELLPRDPSVLELQMQLLVGYRLPFEVVGVPGNQRLRVLPPGYGRAAEGGQARAAAAQ